MVARKIGVLPALLASAANGFAQTMGAGTNTGAVTEATGAVAPEVQITATNLGTGIDRSVTSKSTGSYVIGSVQRTAQFLEIC
jgi:hypothetical protein